jgi:uncharacterized protein DUF5681
MAKFVKGQSGNPAGRPIGARQKLEEPFINALRKQWDESGETALAVMATTARGESVRVMASLMPKELGVTVQQQTPFRMAYFVLPCVSELLRRLADLRGIPSA